MTRLVPTWDEEDWDLDPDFLCVVCEDKRGWYEGDEWVWCSDCEGEEE